MSSPPKERVETKGGHLPAGKAHGVVALFLNASYKHQGHCFCSISPQKLHDHDGAPPKVPVIVSGVVTKGDKDFTPAAAQVAHQKPQPCVPKLPPAQHINQHIHQPRK
uniref:Death-associated protein n=1 Tax=Monopterus albus TaxID=43700 RepID=A0A3Q3J7D7_MONAL